MVNNKITAPSPDIEKLRLFSESLENYWESLTNPEVFLSQIKQKVVKKSAIITERRIKGVVETLKQKSAAMSTRVRFKDVGTVQHIGNGVATVSGLPNVSIDEIVVFPTGAEGMALNLERKHVDLIMLGSEKDIRGGDMVQATGNRLKIPVGSHTLGRIFDPLGNPLDRDELVEASEYRFFSRMAPGVIDRQPVHQSLFTGTKVIDALFPIGRGQRELIVGDRQTGKTTLAVDAIISQKNTNVHCVYVAIGQKKSSTLSVVETLQKNDALSNTAIILSSPEDQPALRYLAPYTGITMAEYFLDQGQDVLIVFDDLSKHANAYRELSLLLRRPPGREAYPGDIFYIHSRLLERACKLSSAHGGGSITALPITTTQNGNISSYISTNLISITDGQIVLDTDLFNQGQKPAIDIGRSVYRELSQYKEVEHFTRFGTEVDRATYQQIEKGKRILSIFNQGPNQPYSLAMTIIELFALSRGYLDKIPVESVPTFEQSLREFFTQKEAVLMHDISTEARLTNSIVDKLNQALTEFIDDWDTQKGTIL